jgi:membrane-associated phospholipid phosphatase
LSAFALILFLNVRLFFACLFSFGISSGVTQFLKRIVFAGSERPKSYFENHFKEIHLTFVKNMEIHGENSFPSGHTTTAFSLLFVIALVSPNNWIKGVCFFVALIIGFSRIYLSQHFFEDVYAGALIGIIFATVFGYIFYFSPWSGKFNKYDTSLMNNLFRPKKDV